MASGGLCPASRNRRHEVWGNKESLETRMPSCPTGRLGAEPLTRVGGQSPGLIYCPKHCGCLSLICAHIRILFFFREKSTGTKWQPTARWAGSTVHTGICNHRPNPEGKDPDLAGQELRPPSSLKNWDGGFKEGQSTSTKVCREMPYSGSAYRC